MTSLHYCSINGGDTMQAIEQCWENEQGEFVVENSEYSNIVKFCPECGEPSPAEKIKHEKTNASNPPLPRFKNKSTMTNYRMPVHAEQFSTAPGAKIPDRASPVMVGKSGRTIMQHEHTDNPNYTPGYALHADGESYILHDGDWLVTNPLGKTTVVQDSDFKTLYIK